VLDRTRSWQLELALPCALMVLVETKNNSEIYGEEIIE